VRKLSYNSIERTALGTWPDVIRKQAARDPLFDSHSQFVDELLDLDLRPNELRKSLNKVNMPFPMFLKHLMILADFGGEPLRLIHQRRMHVFQNAKSKVAFLVIDRRGRKFRLQIREFHRKSRFDLKALGVTPEQMLSTSPATELQIDTALVLLTGHESVNSVLSGQLANSRVGDVIRRHRGNKSAFNTFLSARYLEVSSQVRGARSNRLGQLMQHNVQSALQKELGSNYIFGKKIGKKSYDIVIQRAPSSSRPGSKKSVAIEVLFQETTNSTIERKGNLARAGRRSKSVARCFVIDGYGAFKRESAVKKMIDRSDFSSNANPQQLKLLAQFVRQFLRP